MKLELVFYSCILLGSFNELHPIFFFYYNDTDNLQNQIYVF